MDSSDNCLIIKISDEGTQLSLQGFDENMLINIEQDVDFTPLISKLIELMDSSQCVAFFIESEPESEKVKLIYKSLENIFESYNKTLGNNEEIDLPLDNYNNDDLPF